MELSCITLLPLVLVLVECVAPGACQVAWTPIYLDGNSQVDLWTQEAKGCHCPFDSTRQDCACCVHDGGCHCGRGAPNRCSQCGLEQHCSNMCNVTIDSKYLSARSGKTFGQIKSPSLQGPGFCWYLLQPDTGQRVEIQIYRLINIGRFNGTGCEGGFLQLVDGAETHPKSGERQICGVNERFNPPVVVFADRGSATLLLYVGEATFRSQFLAYFSFTAANSTQGTGFHAKGGRRVEHTECDWLYQDFSCREPGSCVLASPGFPGLYPPNRLCKYHITTSSIHTMIHITFNSLHLPHSRCSTDYIAIYQGSSASSPLQTTLCDKRETSLQYSGPNLLLEFSSGPSIPPYGYNGFLATLKFVEKAIGHDDSNELLGRSSESGIMMDGTSAPRHSTVRQGCDLFFSGNTTRSGHFNTRALSRRSSCILSFHGRSTDIVHLSLFNYMLSAPSCQSVVEIFDGPAEEGVRPSKRICSPLTKHARDPNGRFLEQQTFVSSDNVLTVMLRRIGPVTSHTEADAEFLDGAFVFHDEQVDGTLQPDTLCDVDYYGTSSPLRGTISNPGTQHLFWNIEGTLRCSQRFIPAPNQSITITIERLERLSHDPHCHTQCGDAGCHCRTNLLPLSQMDHLLLVTDTGAVVSCLCGQFQQDWLPVSVRTWSHLRVIYSVAHYNWNMKGFSFRSSYSFNSDAACGHKTFTQNYGEIQTKGISGSNVYYHQDCTWLLNSKQERQLSVQLETAQDPAKVTTTALMKLQGNFLSRHYVLRKVRSLKLLWKLYHRASELSLTQVMEGECSAWNVTIHQFQENTVDGVGETLQTFCPRDHSKKFLLPWRLNSVILRLSAMTTTVPEFTIRWSSQIVEANLYSSGSSSTPVFNCSTVQQIALKLCLCMFLMLQGWTCVLLT